MQHYDFKKFDTIPLSFLFLHNLYFICLFRATLYRLLLKTNQGILFPFLDLIGSR